MPYVLDQHDAEYTSVSGLGEIATLRASEGREFKIPAKAQLPLVGKGLVTFENASTFTLKYDAFVNDATGKLEQKAYGAVSSSTVVRDTQGKLIGSVKGSVVELPRGFQMQAPIASSETPSTPRGPLPDTQPFQRNFESEGGAVVKYYRIFTNFNRAAKDPRQPIRKVSVPPYADAYYAAEADLDSAERAMHGLRQILPVPSTAAPRSPKEVVQIVQGVIGTTTDGQYGPNTNSKLKAWAGTKGISSSEFDARGPRALEAHVAALRLSGPAELEVLGVVWDTWKQRQTRRAQPPAAPLAPLPPETQGQLTADELLRQGIVKEAGITSWLRNYWWLLAAAAVVSVGGYLIWKRRQDTPEEA